MKKIFRFFDKLEDKVRGSLSHYPIFYTIVGGITIVIFWRGVWQTADILQNKGGFLGFIFYEPVTVVITSIILLLSGLFVSFFIGDVILISGLKKEKKITEKTESEVKAENIELSDLKKDFIVMKKELDEVKSLITPQNEK